MQAASNHSAIRQTHFAGAALRHKNTSSNVTLKDPDLKICCDVSMNRHPQDHSRHHLAPAWNGLILIFNLFLRDLG